MHTTKYTVLALLLLKCNEAKGYVINNRIEKNYFYRAKNGEEEEKLLDLIPQKNPDIDPNSKSISGTKFGSVLKGLDIIYPPEQLSKRNAISRTDGYWSFIEAGKEPPQHFTYGEFDFMFFAELLDKAYTHYNDYESAHTDSGTVEVNCEKYGWSGKTFLDIGSGAGRLVIGAAALHPDLNESRGLEILPGLYEESIKNLERCKIANNNENESRLSDEGFDDDEDYNDDEQEIGVNEQEDEYIEPLTGEMNEMQQALQSMTAEEWKALLGDDYDDLFDKDFESDEDDVNDIKSMPTEEEDNENCDNDGFEDIITEEDEIETIPTTIDHRKQDHEVAPNFILPSDDVMIEMIQDADFSKREQTFTSIENFMRISKEEWSEMFENPTDIENDNVQTLAKEEEQELRTLNEAVPDDYVLSFSQNESDSDVEELALSKIRFSCGSFQDPYEYIGDVDVIFVFSSCMTTDMMKDLSDCIGRCKPGTIVISTEFMLQSTGHLPPLENDPNMPHGTYEIDTIETVEGWNWITKRSTAFIQRVTKSVWDGIARERPRLDSQEVAFRIIRDLEAKNLTDNKRFLRQVRNNMVFNGIPDIVQKTELDLAAQNATYIEDDNMILSENQLSATDD